METANNTEIYNSFSEHSQEDIELVKKLAQEEQQRRIEDILGESQRRYAANQVSEIFYNHLRPGFFQRGTSFVLQLLKAVRGANGVLSPAQVQAINAKFQSIGQAGFNTIQDVRHITYNMTLRAQDVADKSAENAAEFKVKAIDTVESARKSFIKVQGATVETFGKVQEATKANIEKAKETIEKAQVVSKESVEKVQVVSKESFEKVQTVAQDGFEKAQQAARLIRSVSMDLIEKVREVINKFSTNSSSAFSLLEEENERARRISSESEIYAIQNALAVSALIKELGPAFYRPTFQPNLFYASRLLSNAECSRRVLRDLTDFTAINNAKAVSRLVDQKFNSPITLNPLPPAKVELVDAITVRPPIAPTM